MSLLQQAEPAPAPTPPPDAGDEASRSDPLGALLATARRARHTGNSVELGFLAVNETHRLAAYRQAALWTVGDGVIALSGVLQPEANAPYVDWLLRACQTLHKQYKQTKVLQAIDLPPPLAADWDEWLPAHMLWLPLASTPYESDSSDTAGAGALLLVRDTPWQPFEIALLDEWRDVLEHAWHSLFRPDPWSWRHWLRQGQHYLRARPALSWWRQRRLLWSIAILLALLIPVRLTVLAPGELVPANPAVVRAPLDGVLGAFDIKPNQMVKAGQPLFIFDQAPLQSKLDVARQARSTAEAEYRQAEQAAVSDTKSKAQLAILAGKIEERRADADYLEGQLQRSQVVAPQDGMALFDDSSEWIGKPVTTGERIMRIARPDDVEVEAWLAVGDAIALPDGVPVKLYLNANPLSSIAAHMRYTAHDAVQRPDGSYAYRVRATLDAPTDQRVGLKGTAKLTGGWTPLCYWILRRPLAALRQATGH
jgi:hypothetical protein